ncbi:hypothetical protein O6H91_05G095500 [Diphasiastrum complanatum]|uniref:Uncharacterized protein n=1 Tax=Diphasiastrum complanatum TaxID=34168 RepID=A0ACC2DRH2_DIPCM|nr:hypothetical protein O6H91_05G095500 [Diphasiastrum complanatum]
MKVVALVSGGKDSCYAMMRCVDYGHEIVALANLLPMNDDVDELDSFMYQTVGHQIVEAYAECMGLPLFRKRILGKASVQEMRYSETQGDEVEDLEVLLRTVKRHYPSIDAVSSGAIASDYQRLRVENVCSRLGLVSLAYLWKQEQSTLLEHMIDRGIHAVLVKVAALGLEPYKHLGKDLSTLRPLLTLLSNMYGCNVCGEGGEYESLTLDCPLFKNARIILDGFNIVLHSPDSIASVGVLHISNFHLERKSECLTSQSTYPDTASADCSLVTWVTEDAEGKQTSSPVVSLASLCPQKDDIGSENGDGLLEFSNHTSQLCRISIGKGSELFTCACWRESANNQFLDVKDELMLILQALKWELREKGLGWADVLFVHLYLADMKKFADANDVYLKFITDKECIKGVPSRCTVEVPLVEGGLGSVMVELLVAHDKSKKVLHVQSISCWAPSCIGPYSQATMHRGILHMAGQLGLHPATMSLVSAKENDSPEFKLGSQAFIPTPLVHFVLVPALPKGALVEVELSFYVAKTESISSESEDDDETFEVDGHRMPYAEKAFQYFDSSGALKRLSKSARVKDNINGQSMYILNQLCKILASVEVLDESCKPRSHDVICERKTQDFEHEEELFGALEDCLEFALTALDQADLHWGDVLIYRVFFNSEEISPLPLRKSLETFANLRETEVVDQARCGPACEFPKPLLIPVCGTGLTSELQSLITIDLLALSKNHRVP